MSETTSSYQVRSLVEMITMKSFSVVKIMAKSNISKIKTLRCFECRETGSVRSNKLPTELKLPQ